MTPADQPITGRPRDVDRFVDLDGPGGGESFSPGRCRDAPDLLEWSVGLPMGDEVRFEGALLYWLDLLTELRAVLPDAGRHVHLDDRDVPWPEERAHDEPAG